MWNSVEYQALPLELKVLKYLAHFGKSSFPELKKNRLVMGLTESELKTGLSRLVKLGFITREVITRRERYFLWSQASMREYQLRRAGQEAIERYKLREVPFFKEFALKD